MFFVHFTFLFNLLVFDCAPQPDIYVDLFSKLWTRGEIWLFDLGSSKFGKRKAGSGTRGVKKAIFEMENGTVPLPAKLCFICERWVIAHIGGGFKICERHLLFF